MSQKIKEKTFTSTIISAGRLTIPSYYLSELELEEGDRVNVKISRRWYDYHILYKDKETEKIESIIFRVKDPAAIVAMKKAKQLLEGISVEWAYIDHVWQWIVEPETVKPVESRNPNITV